MSCVALAQEHPSSEGLHANLDVVWSVALLLIRSVAGIVLVVNAC